MSKSTWSNLYLVRLFQSNKFLFAFVIVFIFFQLYFNQKRIHSFPWFVWDMYSRPSVVPKENSQFVLVFDNKIFNHTKLPYWKEEVIFKTIKMYNWQIQNNYNDPMRSAVQHRTKYFNKQIEKYAENQILNHKKNYEYAYKNWLLNYIKKNISNSFTTCELKEIKLEFVNNNYKPIDTLTYFSISND